jgi:hypothetical protein
MAIALVTNHWSQQNFSTAVVHKVIGKQIEYMALMNDPYLQPRWKRGFSNEAGCFDKLLPLPQPPVRARTDARESPSAQRATQLRRVLARVYAVSIQKQITTTVP